MSPEQIKGLPPDNRTDLWALGVILYQALTGELPFAGDSYPVVLQRVLHHQPEPPGTRREGIDRDLDYIVMKLVRKEPAHRYGRAEDLLADLASAGGARSEPDDLTLTMPLPEKAQAPRLAVLSFELLSSDPDDKLLATGLVEDLIVDLTRVEGVRVASRAEVEGYSERTVPPRTLGRELGVDYVLTGSVRRLANRGRMSAQLIRASDGHLLWADRFERTLEDLFGVQEEISRSIADALELALKPDEREILQRAPTKNTDAYALYLRARELLGTTRDENLRAERLLLEALELDDEFALAHAALGECYAVRGIKWWASLEMVDKAMTSVRRALELEPGLPDAYYVEMIVRRLEGDPEKILAAIEKVLETNPDDGQAREWAAWGYMVLGRPEEALPILEKLTDRYMALAWLSACYTMLGRQEDTERTDRLLRERLVETVCRNPEMSHVRSLLGIALVRSGDTETGIAQAERALALAPDDGRMSYNLACAYALAGQPERAIEQIKKAIADLPTYLSDWPREDPDLASLHDHPEFKRIFP
jgi:adenylate cyclase